MVSSQQIAKISTWNNDNGCGSNTRRKIEIKRVEESSKRHVTFSKRKQGLFNKVTELSILCQAETALIVKSQNGKLYSCGYPNPDIVLRRFLNKASSHDARSEKNNTTRKCKQKEYVETLRIQYEATQELLKQEKQRRDEANAKKASMGFPCWWDYSIDEMGLEELEQFKASLEQLKISLMATMEEKRVNSIQFQPMMKMPFHSMLPMQNKYSNFPPILNNEGLSSIKQEQQAWNLRNNGIIVSSSNNSSLGTWELGNNNAIANSSHHSYFHPNADFGHYYHN